MFLYIVRHQPLFAFFAALLWVGLIVVLGMTWLGKLTLPELKTDAERHLNEVDRYFTAMDESFLALSDIDAATCSSAVLQEFQREMFRNSYLQDVFFLEKDGYKPLCTVTMGATDDAVPLPKPDTRDLFHADREVWRALPLALFGGKQAAYTVKEGRIALSSSIESIEAPTTDFAWQTYFPSWTEGIGYYPIAGTEGLHQRFADAQGSALSTMLAYDACAETIPSCITVSAPWPMVFTRNKTFVNIGILLTAVTSMMVYHLVRRWLTHLGSPIGRLTRGLKRKRGFSCVYQPVVDLDSGAPLGCEVLARFEDSLGSISPADFVPIINNMRKTWEFTELILDMALAELKSVTDLNRKFWVSVNFFPQDLCEENLDKIEKSRPIAQAIGSGVHLNFEVLETGLADASDMRVALNYIQAQGFTVSIDDFGTGSSNLHQLRAIRANSIKVDRSFISGLSADSSSVRSSLVHHIVEIAHEMKVEIIAEGVESFTQLQVLSNLGIRYAQGYFFSPPVSVERLMDFVRMEEALEGLKTLAKPQPATVARLNV